MGISDGTILEARMMVHKAIKLTVLVGALALTTGITCGAGPLHKPAPAPAAKFGSTPELVAADQRVDGAKAEWDRAKKQLEAARALLRAAEADYKAAVADREALALKTAAQNLADESGLPIATRPATAPAAAKPVAPPAAAPTPAATTPTPGIPAAAANTSAADLSATRIQPVDFAAQPAESAEPIQMR
jgi:hypothetical protein